MRRMGRRVFGQPRLPYPDWRARGWWQRSIDLGWKLLGIARQIGGLNEAELGRLDEVRASLEHYRRFGLTEKNLKLVRLVLTEGIWSEVTSLPNSLMREAHAAKDHAPIKAALTAQFAVAIAILSFAPVRLSNLVNIELGQNLTKPGGLHAPCWLVFPHYDVKNRVDLNFQFDEALKSSLTSMSTSFGRCCSAVRTPRGCFRARPAIPRRRTCSAPSLPSASRRPPACGSLPISSGMPLRQSISSIIQETTRPCGASSGIGTSRRQSTSTAVFRRCRRPRNSGRLSAGRSNSILKMLERIGESP
jgi:hypothetical protein